MLQFLFSECKNTVVLVFMSLVSVHFTCLASCKLVGFLVFSPFVALLGSIISIVLFAALKASSGVMIGVELREGVCNAFPRCSNFFFFVSPVRYEDVFLLDLIFAIFEYLGTLPSFFVFSCPWILWYPVPFFLLLMFFVVLCLLCPCYIFCG